MAKKHLELADGVFIEYELSDLGGAHCSSAQWDCTYDDRDQYVDHGVLMDRIGLDNNESLKMYVNQMVLNHGQ